MDVESIPLGLNPDDAYLINPGAVGQPRDGDPRAAYAIYDSHGACVDYFRPGVRYRERAAEDAPGGSSGTAGGPACCGPIGKKETEFPISKNRPLQSVSCEGVRKLCFLFPF